MGILNLPFISSLPTNARPTFIY